MKRLGLCLLLVCGSAAPQQHNFSSLDERFRYYVHRTYTSRQRLAFLVADSGMGHLLNDPEEWGQSPQSFGYRCTSNFTRRVVANSIEFGVGALLNEDARYRSSQLQGFRKRLRYAAAAAFTARVPDGTTRPAYSRFSATAGGALVSLTWRPRPASPSDVLLGIGFGLLNRIPDNLLDEFGPDMRRTGKRVVRVIWQH